jgi:hypothetical protein
MPVHPNEILETALQTAQKNPTISLPSDCLQNLKIIIPSLKYYLRLISQPQEFLIEYTNLLETEFKRGSGIKKQHLQVWQQIRQTVLNQDTP